MVTQQKLIRVLTTTQRGQFIFIWLSDVKMSLEMDTFKYLQLKYSVNSVLMSIVNVLTCMLDEYQGGKKRVLDTTQELVTL